MAREKFQTLTEQMFYILLCLRQEQCGADIMARVAELTGGDSLASNIQLVFNNARLAARTAAAYCRL